MAETEAEQRKKMFLRFMNSGEYMSHKFLKSLDMKEALKIRFSTDELGHVPLGAFSSSPSNTIDAILRSRVPVPEKATLLEEALHLFDDYDKSTDMKVTEANQGMTFARCFLQAIVGYNLPIGVTRAFVWCFQARHAECRTPAKKQACGCANFLNRILRPLSRSEINVGKLEFILRQPHVNLAFKHSDGGTALMESIALRNWPAFRLLLPRMDMTSPERYVNLSLACHRGFERAVESLLLNLHEIPDLNPQLQVYSMFIGELDASRLDSAMTLGHYLWDVDMQGSSALLHVCKQNTLLAATKLKMLNSLGCQFKVDGLYTHVFNHRNSHPHIDQLQRESYLLKKVLKLQKHEGDGSEKEVMSKCVDENATSCLRAFLKHSHLGKEYEYILELIEYAKTLEKPEMVRLLKKHIKETRPDIVISDSDTAP